MRQATHRAMSSAAAEGQVCRSLPLLPMKKRIVRFRPLLQYRQPSGTKRSNGIGDMPMRPPQRRKGRPAQGSKSDGMRARRTGH